MYKPEIRSVRVNTALGSGTDGSLSEAGVHLALSWREGEEVSCLWAEGCFTQREDPRGYPDCFIPEGISLTLQAPKGEPFLAVYQHKAWWTRPGFGNSLREVPEKTQMLLRRVSREEESSEEEESSREEESSEEEEYEVFLAVTGSGIRADLSGAEKDEEKGKKGEAEKEEAEKEEAEKEEEAGSELKLLLSPLYGNQRTLNGPCLVYGRGRDPYALIERCEDYALHLLGREKGVPEKKTLPPVFRGLGWCTWDSLGQGVSEAAILEKMEEFREKKIPLSWVLIDDGWSLANREKLTLRGLLADPERFPEGLAGTVKTLKEKYGVKHVGVWQAMKGYWYGVEEGSPAQEALAPYLMRYPSGELSVKPTERDSFGFWSTWHRALEQSGIDFVKIDGQGSFATMCRGSLSREGSMEAVYSGMEASVLLHFGGNLIHCMGMAPENVWSRGGIPLSRSSDDYTPTVAGSIVEHALQNAYDNVYQGGLYIGDWDMFWSEHEEAVYGCLLRAISGGPVYVSDALGKTDRQLISRLLAEDGSLLLCDGIARPTLDCLTRETLRGGRALKLYNTLPGGVYVAAFSWDLPGESLEESFRLEEMPGSWKQEEKKKIKQNQAEKEEDTPSWLICDWAIREVTRSGGSYSFTMGSREARLFAVVREETEEHSVTVLGLLDKYIGLAAVKTERLPGQTLVEVKAAGCLGFAVRGDHPQAWVPEGEEWKSLPIESRGLLHTVTLERPGIVRIEG